MRVELRDVDIREIEVFVQALQRRIEYDPKTLADAVEDALRCCDCTCRCISQDDELYIIH